MWTATELDTAKQRTYSLNMDTTKQPQDSLTDATTTQRPNRSRRQGKGKRELNAEAKDRKRRRSGVDLKDIKPPEPRYLTAAEAADADGINLSARSIGQATAQLTRLVTEDDILKAIPGSGALLGVIAVRTGSHPVSIGNWARKSAAIRTALHAEAHMTCDLAEAQLIAGIRAGNIDCIKLYLRAKAANRGYCHAAGSQPLPVGPCLPEATDAQSRPAAIAAEGIELAKRLEAYRAVRRQQLAQPKDSLKADSGEEE